MAIIKTERNHVYALEAMEGDCWVRTLVNGRTLLTEHIDQYQAAVDWAVSIADQFEHAIHIVPINPDDFMRSDGDKLERRLAEMPPEQRHALRQEVVTAMAEVMRDCHDPAIRAEAFDVLAKMKEL